MATLPIFVSLSRALHTEASYIPVSNTLADRPTKLNLFLQKLLSYRKCPLFHGLFLRNPKGNGNTHPEAYLNANKIDDTGYADYILPGLRRNKMSVSSSGISSNENELDEVYPGREPTKDPPRHEIKNESGAKTKKKEFVSFNNYIDNKSQNQGNYDDDDWLE